MRHAPTGPGNALPLEALAGDAERLSVEAFEAKHGSAFLLLSAAARARGEGSTSTHLLLQAEDPGAHTAELALVVYALRQKDGGAHLISIGRSPRHDLVIPDPSVSRFHAFVKRDDAGAFLIQDAGSSNGTAVNGEAVPPRGAGSPLPIKAGDTLRVGQVQFTFIHASALRDFVRMAGG